MKLQVTLPFCKVCIFTVKKVKSINYFTLNMKMFTVQHICDNAENEIANVPKAEMSMSLDDVAW